MIARENGQVLYLVSASTATICTVIANEGAIAEEEKVGIRVEEGTTSIASEAIDVPPVAS